jgi:Ran GTPase-activating protein 1
MATSKKIFSLEGKGLKLDTAADLEPHIEFLRSMSDVEEVRFLGNTLGVEACKALGDVLETKKSLQVSLNLASQRNLYKSILDMELC